MLFFLKENDRPVPIKYPSSETDLAPFRYPDHEETETETQYTGPTATGTSYYASVDTAASKTRTTSSSSRDDFMHVVKGLLTDRQVRKSY